MKLTSLEVLHRRKSRICLAEGADPAFASFVLPTAEVRALDLREGQEIDEEKMGEIRAVLRRECLARCGMLLKGQDYTEARLMRKLLEAGFPEPVAREAMEEMRQAGYLDDGRYAEAYVRTHKDRRSQQRLRSDLLERGVAPEHIEAAFAAAGTPEELAEEEMAQIRRHLEKKRIRPEELTWEERQKVMAALYRRGFSAERIRAALGE